LSQAKFSSSNIPETRAPQTDGMSMRIHRRQALAWAGALATLQARAATGTANTQATPPAQVPAAPQDETWNDPARGRVLPLRLRWPSTPGPWPWLLFSHGLGGSREGGDAWGQAWCEAGFVVLHLQHAGSDIEVQRQGGVELLRAAGTAQQLLARVADVRFVLSEALRRQREGLPGWRDLRPDAIGLAGHSFGAITTLATAGQRFFAAGGDVSDPRPRAFMALSPSPSRTRLTLQQQFGAIQRPCLLVTGSLDGDPFGSYSSGERRAEVYEGLPPGERALLWLDGADHMSLAGNRAARINGRGPFARAAVAQQREDAHHALVAQMSTAWWRWRLLADSQAQLLLQRAAAGGVLGPGDRLTIG
jgi:predicted dienelactone hydrolase